MNDMKELDTTKYFRSLMPELLTSNDLTSDEAESCQITALHMLVEGEITAKHIEDLAFVAKDLVNRGLILPYACDMVGNVVLTSTTGWKNVQSVYIGMYANNALSTADLNRQADYSVDVLMAMGDELADHSWHVIDGRVQRQALPPKPCCFLTL